MKTKITALAVVFSLAATAQTSFTLEDHDNSQAIAAGAALYVSSEATKTHSAHIDIINTSATTHTYNVRRHDVTLNSTATNTAAAYFCMGGGCYTPFITEGMDPVVLKAGERTSELAGDFQMLLAELDELDVVGFSHVKYTIYNVNDANDTLQFSIRYNDPSAGFQNNMVFETSFALAPNPASGHANVRVTLPVSANCTVKIYNALGAVVGNSSHMLSAGKNSIPLEIDGFKKGIYFISLEAGSEKAVRRLIVN